MVVTIWLNEGSMKEKHKVMEMTVKKENSTLCFSLRFSGILKKSCFFIIEEATGTAILFYWYWVHDRMLTEWIIFIQLGCWACAHCSIQHFVQKPAIQNMFWLCAIHRIHVVCIAIGICEKPNKAIKKSLKPKLLCFRDEFPFKENKDVCKITSASDPQKVLQNLLHCLSHALMDLGNVGRKI